MLIQRSCLFLVERFDGIDERENGNSEVRNWELMRRLMTRHFIPPDVRDKFYLKLQRLKQGDELSIEDYAKEFKLFVIASDLGES